MQNLESRNKIEDTPPYNDGGTIGETLTLIFKSESSKKPDEKAIIELLQVYFRFYSNATEVTSVGSRIKCQFPTSYRKTFRINSWAKKERTLEITIENIEVENIYRFYLPYLWDKNKKSFEIGFNKLWPSFMAVGAIIVFLFFLPALILEYFNLYPNGNFFLWHLAGLVVVGITMAGGKEVQEKFYDKRRVVYDKKRGIHE